MEWLLVPDGLVRVFQKLLIYSDFHAQPSLVFTDNGPKKKKYPGSGSCVDKKCLVDVRGQRRMGRLVRDDRKATVNQITTPYNQDMQNTMSECTTRRTLKQTCYSSRRPHPLVPIEHRLNATAYLSIVADNVHPFMTTVYPSSNGYFHQDNAPCHKA